MSFRIFSALLGTTGQTINPGHFREFFMNVGGSFGDLFSVLWNAICGVFYIPVKWLLAFTDFLQYFIQKLIGLDYWLNNNVYTFSGAVKSDLLFSFLYNETVQRVFRTMSVVFVVLLIIFTIFAIIRSEWQYITGEKFGDGSNTKIGALRNAMKAIALVLIFPLVLTLGIISSNAILASLVKALNIDQSSTFGGTLFLIGSKNANKYRQYAKSGKRQPISDTISFYVKNGRVVRLGNTELHNDYVDQYKNFYEYLQEIQGSNATKYTVNTMIKAIDFEKNFKGYAVGMDIDDERYYYLVSCEDSGDETAVNSKQAMYYYLRDILQVDIISPGNYYDDEDGYEIYKGIGASKFSPSANNKGFFSANLSGESNEAVWRAVYNTWGYDSIYDTTRDFESSLGYAVINASDKKLTVEGSGATQSVLEAMNLQGFANVKMLYNGNIVSSYFDGGQFGLVQLQNEYYVMADVVDFMNNTGVTLYMIDATSSQIDWAYDGYQPDDRWIGGKKVEGNPSRIEPISDRNFDNTIFQNSIPFVVSYSDLISDVEAGNVLYTAKAGVSNEFEGSKYIMCFKVIENGSARYVPVVNRKDFKDPITHDIYRFSSDYLSSSYRGVIVAKGVFATRQYFGADGDNGSVNALNGSPTYIRSNAKMTAEDNGEVTVSKEEPYYYYMDVTGQMVQYAGYYKENQSGEVNSDYINKYFAYLDGFSVDDKVNVTLSSASLRRNVDAKLKEDTITGIEDFLNSFEKKTVALAADNFNFMSSSGYTVDTDNVATNSFKLKNGEDEVQNGELADALKAVSITVTDTNGQSLNLQWVEVSTNEEKTLTFVTEDGGAFYFINIQIDETENTFKFADVSENNIVLSQRFLIEPDVTNGKIRTETYVLNGGYTTRGITLTLEDLNGWKVKFVRGDSEEKDSFTFSTVYGNNASMFFVNFDQNQSGHDHDNGTYLFEFELVNGGLQFVKKEGAEDGTIQAYIQDDVTIENNTATFKQVRYEEVDNGYTRSANIDEHADNIIPNVKFGVNVGYDYNTLFEAYPNSSNFYIVVNGFRYYITAAATSNRLTIETEAKSKSRVVMTSNTGLDVSNGLSNRSVTNSFRLQREMQNGEYGYAELDYDALKALTIKIKYQYDESGSGSAGATNDADATYSGIGTSGQLEFKFENASTARQKNGYFYVGFDDERTFYIMRFDATASKYIKAEENLGVISCLATTFSNANNLGNSWLPELPVANNYANGDVYPRLEMANVTLDTSVYSSNYVVSKIGNLQNRFEISNNGVTQSINNDFVQNLIISFYYRISANSSVGCNATYAGQSVTNKGITYSLFSFYYAGASYYFIVENTDEYISVCSYTTDGDRFIANAESNRIVAQTRNYTLFYDYTARTQPSEVGQMIATLSPADFNFSASKGNYSLFITAEKQTVKDGKYQYVNVYFDTHGTGRLITLGSNGQNLLFADPVEKNQENINDYFYHSDEYTFQLYNYFTAYTGNSQRTYTQVELIADSNNYLEPTIITDVKMNSWYGQNCKKVDENKFLWQTYTKFLTSEIPYLAEKDIKDISFDLTIDDKTYKATDTGIGIKGYIEGSGTATTIYDLRMFSFDKDGTIYYLTLKIDYKKATIQLCGANGANLLGLNSDVLFKDPSYQITIIQEGLQPATKTFTDVKASQFSYYKTSAGMTLFETISGGDGNGIYDTESAFDKSSLKLQVKNNLIKNLVRIATTDTGFAIRGVGVGDYADYLSNITDQEINVSPGLVEYDLDKSGQGVTEAVGGAKPLVDDEKWTFTVLVDSDFRWDTQSNSYGLYNGKSYVATIYKNIGTVINSPQDISNKSVRILYDYNTYYNVVSTNSFVAGDGTSSNEANRLVYDFYEAFNDSMVTCFYRTNTKNNIFHWTFKILLLINIRFKLSICTYDMARDMESAGSFKISNGIAFDYFFDSADVSLSTFFVQSKISFWIILIASALIIKTLMTALWGVIKRFYEITLYFIAMPAVASTIPLDNGQKFKDSIQGPLIKKVLSTYGVILGINVFFILLTPVRSLSQVFTEEDIATSGTYFLKYLPISANWLNDYVYILFMLVAFTMIETLPGVISNILGAEDTLSKGKETKGQVKESLSSAGDIVSGRSAIKGIKSAVHTATDFIPGKELVMAPFRKAGKLIDKGIQDFGEGVGRSAFRKKDDSTGTETGKENGKESSRTENDEGTPDGEDNGGGGGGPGGGGTDGGADGGEGGGADGGEGAASPAGYVARELARQAGEAAGKASDGVSNAFGGMADGLQDALNTMEDGTKPEESNEVLPSQENAGFGAPTGAEGTENAGEFVNENGSAYDLEELEEIKDTDSPEERARKEKVNAEITARNNNKTSKPVENQDVSGASSETSVENSSENTIEYEDANGNVQKLEIPEEIDKNDSPEEKARKEEANSKRLEENGRVLSGEDVEEANEEEEEDTEGATKDSDKPKHPRLTKFGKALGGRLRLGVQDLGNRAKELGGSVLKLVGLDNVFNTRNKDGSKRSLINMIGLAVPRLVGGVLTAIPKLPRNLLNVAQKTGKLALGLDLLHLTTGYTNATKERYKQFHGKVPRSMMVLTAMATGRGVAKLSRKIGHGVSFLGKRAMNTRPGRRARAFGRRIAAGTSYIKNATKRYVRVAADYIKVLTLPAENFRQEFKDHKKKIAADLDAARYRARIKDTMRLQRINKAERAKTAQTADKAKGEIQSLLANSNVKMDANATTAEIAKLINSGNVQDPETKAKLTELFNELTHAERLQTQLENQAQELEEKLKKNREIALNLGDGNYIPRRARKAKLQEEMVETYGTGQYKPLPTMSAYETERAVLLANVGALNDTAPNGFERQLAKNDYNATNVFTDSLAMVGTIKALLSAKDRGLKVGQVANAAQRTANVALGHYVADNNDSKEVNNAIVHMLNGVDDTTKLNAIRSTLTGDKQKNFDAQFKNLSGEELAKKQKEVLNNYEFSGKVNGKTNELSISVGEKGKDAAKIAAGHALYGSLFVGIDSNDEKMRNAASQAAEEQGTLRRINEYGGTHIAVTLDSADSGALADSVISRARADKQINGAAIRDLLKINDEGRKILEQLEQEDGKLDNETLDRLSVTDRTLENFIRSNRQEYNKLLVQKAKDETIAGSFKLEAWDLLSSAEQSRKISSSKAEMEAMSSTSLLSGASDRERNKIIANASIKLVTQSGKTGTALKQEILKAVQSEAKIKVTERNIGNFGANVISRAISKNPTLLAAIDRLTSYDARLAVNNDVLGLGVAQIRRGVNKEINGSLAELYDTYAKNYNVKDSNGNVSNIKTASNAQLEGFLRSSRWAQNLVLGSIANRNFAPTTPKTEREKVVEHKLSTSAMTPDAIFNTFLNKNEHTDYDKDLLFGMLNNIKTDGTTPADVKAKLDALDSVKFKWEDGINIINSMNLETRNKLLSEFNSVLTRDQKSDLVEIGARNGLLTLSNDEKEKVTSYGNANASRYTVLYELGQTKDNLPLATEKDTAVDTAYKLESDSISSEQVHEFLSRNSAANPEAVEAIVARYMSGTGEDDTDETRLRYAKGLGHENDVIVSQFMTEDERGKYIREYERGNNKEFASLDQAEKNKYLAEKHLQNADDGERKKADAAYIQSLMNSGVLVEKKNFTVKNQGTKQSKLYNKEEIIDFILKRIKASGQTVDSYLSTKEGSMLFKDSKAPANLNQTILAKMDSQTFADLLKKVGRNSQDDTNSAIETIKRQIFEENYAKRQQNGLATASDLPEETSMAPAEKRDYEYRIYAINAQLRNNPNSDILKNILQHTSFANEEFMLREMANKQGIKNAGKMSASELKNLLSVSTINEYFGQNKALEDMMIRAGANNIYTTLGDSQLDLKKREAVENNDALKTDVLSKLMQDDKSVHNMLEARSQYLGKDGKFKPDKYEDVAKAIKQLENNTKDGTKSEFSKNLYQEVSQVVSYNANSTTKQQNKFFNPNAETRIKNISEAFDNRENTVFTTIQYTPVSNNYSAIVGDPHKQVLDDAKREIKRMETQELAGLRKQIEQLSTYKFKGAEFEVEARKILGKYYDKVYGTRDKYRTMLEGDLGSKIPSIQKNDILQSLDALFEKSIRSVDSVAALVPAKKLFGMDERFREPLTGAIKTKAGRVDTSKISALVSKTGAQNRGLETTNIKELMDKNPDYKAVVESYQSKLARTKELQDKINASENRLQELYKTQNKSQIKAEEANLKALITRLGITQPVLEDLEKRKSEFEHKYASTRDSNRITTERRAQTPREDVFRGLTDLQGNKLDASKLSEEQKKELTTAYNELSSQLKSTIDRISKSQSKLKESFRDFKSRYQRMNNNMQRVESLITQLTTENKTLNNLLQQNKNTQTEQTEKFKRQIQSNNEEIARLQKAMGTFNTRTSGFARSKNFPTKKTDAS